MILRRKHAAAERIVYIINDGMHPRITQRELQAGRLPNLAYLVANGVAKWDTVSVFPTSTPTAVTSIVTGAAPDKHGIPGMYWFDRATRGPVYYGDNLGVIASHFGRFFENVIGRLNYVHLDPKVRTVFERLDLLGHSAGSINSMCFRGPHAHPTTLPYFIRVIPGVRFNIDRVFGPPQMRWGDFARSGKAETRVFGDHGPFKQFGISDACTMEAFFELIETGTLPEFLLLYFPDNDVWSHQHGPEASGVHLRKWDADLGRVLDALGGRERAVLQNNFYIIADHAQVPVGCGSHAVIDLDVLLGEFRRLTVDSIWSDHDLFVGPNGRFAQLYLDPAQPGLHNRVLTVLKREEGIEHILWKDGDRYQVLAPTGDRLLTFERGLRGRDRHGNLWRWRGAADVLGVRNESLRIEFDGFPDAFERIAHALDNPASGEILLTARAGFEFCGNGEEVHMGGGSHGGLLAEESFVPFIACGPDVVEKKACVQRISDLVDVSLRLQGWDGRPGAERRAA